MYFDIPAPTALMSGSPAVRLHHLTPDESVTLRAESTDRHGEVWRSAAAFLIPASGTLDLARDAPVSGSYSGADPDGLIWSLRPRETLENAYFEPPDGAFEVQLSLERHAQTVDSATLRRLTRSPDLREVEVNADGVVGRLFVPSGERRGAALLLGGSEGGLHLSRAALLASHGVVVLAQAYFGLPGVPEQLINLPLETFGRGLRWLRARSEVAGRRVMVTGASKGGEAALLIGAHFPGHVSAVAAIVPSGAVYEGIDRTGAVPAEALKSSWSRGGVPLPYLPYHVADWSVFFSSPEARMSVAHQEALDAAGPATLAAATIPVERIRAPVLLVSGGDDGIWPSATLSRIAERRLRDHRLPVEHLSDARAGHALSLPGLPTFIRSPHGSLGGSPEADARLQRLGWAATLALLDAR